LMGKIENEIRPPLYALAGTNLDKLRKELVRLGLVQ